MALSSTDVKYFKIAVGTENLGKETSCDITARCPVCGDSRTNKRSKRLHLYDKNGSTKVNCFNGDCAATNRSMASFLKNFFPSIFENYKRETFFGNINNYKNNSSGDVFEDLKKSETNHEQEIKQKEVVTHNLFNYFENIIESDDAIKYLLNRGVDYFSNDYEWYFGKSDLKIGDKLYKLTNSIIIPLYYNDEMYGFYSRNIHKKEFFTYMPEQNIGYKIWNWFNIDKNKPVYIFEGIFDALSSGHKNIIALMGAKIPDERLKELKEPIFVLDNDKTGWINSIEYLKKGYNVYIQPNKYIQKDMNSLHTEIKDLNIKELINNNIFSGIMGIIKLKNKL